MRLRLYILLILFVLVMVPAYALAAGKLGGTILYGVGEYTARVDGEEVKKIAAQNQQISLNYGLNGYVYNQQFGKYKLMLGYEFNINDPEIRNYGIKDPSLGRVKSDKILFQGDLRLAPGGLPFRLNAYARDIHTTKFTPGSDLVRLPVGDQEGTTNKGSLIRPDINTDMQNGTHRELGATLVLGIKNGSYNGQYRDILSQIPRIFVDYRQIDVSDLSNDADKEHYRARDIAFVSLNKKDNWAHFRHHDYVNFLDSSQNFNSTQIMLGTVDQTLQRQWINLTNWIKLSGDISYNRENIESTKEDRKFYQINMFAVAKRPELDASVYSTFRRETEQRILTQAFDFPIYFNYEPNRESTYRGNLRASFFSESFVVDVLDPGASWGDNSRRDLDSRSELNFDLGSEFFRTGAVVFKPRMRLGIINQNGAQGTKENLTLEITSRRSNNSLPWTAGYYVETTQSSVSDGTSSVLTSLEQSLYGSVEINLSSALRSGLRGTVEQRTGRNANQLKAWNDSLDTGFSAGGRSVNDSEHSLTYDGLIFVEHTGNRVSNRLEFKAHATRTDLAREENAQVAHLLKLNGKTHRFELNSILARGNEPSVASLPFEYVNSVESVSGGEIDVSWSSKALYTYNPDRRLSVSLISSVQRSLANEEADWFASEKVVYRFYSYSGQIREIAEILEEIGVERSSTTLSKGRGGSLFLHVVAAIFPTKNIYAKIDGKFVRFPSGKAGECIIESVTGMKFDKLQLELSYGRAAKDAEGALSPEIWEQRWAFNVKKIF